MRRPIARIKINAGNPGWYDPLTNIHLTITRPEAIVYEGANTTNIKKGIAYKLVSVVDGDLDVNSASIEPKKVEVEKTVREVVSQPKHTEDVEVQIPVVEEEKVEEETITEPVEETIEEVEEIVEAEPVVEEKVEEEKPKKKSTKKTTKSTKTKKEEK